MAYVRNDILVTRRDDLEIDSVEGLWLEIVVTKSRNFLLGTFCGPDSSSQYYDNQFMTKLDIILACAAVQEKETILTGDFNCCFMSSKCNSPDSEQLKSLFKSMSFVVVNDELAKVGDWLDANKLSLNTSKSNFVIFHPYQRKLDYIVHLKIYNNDLKKSVSLEQKTFVKYLGILIDNNLSWKYHIDYISSKVSKGIGIIARLRHLVPFATLLNIYRSLIEPYISYGLIAWGQAANTHLNKVLILQKRALRLMYFADSKSHSAPLLVNSRILPITMLYSHLVSSLMHDIDNHRAPSNISMLFIHSEQVHHHFTRFSATANLYVKASRTNQLLFSFARIGVRLWNSIPKELRIKNRTPFKRELKNRLLKLLENEEMNVDIRCSEICKYLLIK